MPCLIFQRRFYSSFFNVAKKKADKTVIAHGIIFLFLILFTVYCFADPGVELTETAYTKSILTKFGCAIVWAIFIVIYYLQLKELVKEAKEDMEKTVRVTYTSNEAEESSTVSSEDNPSSEARSVMFEVTERQAYLRSEEDVKEPENRSASAVEEAQPVEQQSEDSEEVLCSEEENYRSSEEKSVGLRTRKHDRTSRPN